MPQTLSSTAYKDDCVQRLNEQFGLIAPDRSMPYHRLRSASSETLCFLRQAAFVVVWNGSHPFGTWVMNMRRRLNLPVASVLGNGSSTETTI